MKNSITKSTLAGLTVVVITIFVFSNYCPSSQAQSSQPFTRSEKFSIPNLNGTISFAVNGSYSQATLTNNTWVFKDLTLNNQSIPGFGLNDFQSTGNLTFSTRNSNVTILAYVAVNNSFHVSLLSYMAEGKGNQMVNFDLNSSNPSNAAEWSVIIPNNVILVEGHGWSLLPDNTLVINSAAGNVTVVHFDLNLPAKSNSPFYIQHSVILVTVVMTVIALTVALIIRVRTTKRNS